uniref:Uncharacterized protein n=1 Tax=Melopsittacus undulatus TaxID=13146 RepID=A0A8C6K2E1_MELUD
MEDAHGLNTEVTCAAIEIHGFYFVTGACDGTVKIWVFESGQEVKALPLAKCSKDECRLLKIVYLKADESQHALLALEQSGKMKIIQGNSVETYLYVTWVLPEAVSFPRKNPVVPLLLKPDTLQTHDFFPDIQFLSDTSSPKNDTENFVPSVEIKCFAVLKVEGCSLIATGSANGAIILWDFESATVRCLCEINEDSQASVLQASGVNAMLFLVHSAFSFRKYSSLSSATATVRSHNDAVPEHKSSSLSLQEENVKSGEINTEKTTEGHIMRWYIASFLEGPQRDKNQIKEEICWRAHATEVIDLFHEEEKNVVVTASIDGSVRLWNAMNGYYLGYYGQPRKFEVFDTTRLILPCDVNTFPIIIKEESKYMEEEELECPLVLDRDKWKSLTRPPSHLKGLKHMDTIQDSKFFKSLASPKIYKQPVKCFEPGNRLAGAVFGYLPIYKLEKPTEERMPPSLQKRKAETPSATG